MFWKKLSLTRLSTFSTLGIIASILAWAATIVYVDVLVYKIIVTFLALVVGSNFTAKVVSKHYEST